MSQERKNLPDAIIEYQVGEGGKFLRTYRFSLTREQIPSMESERFELRVVLERDGDLDDLGIIASKVQEYILYENANHFLQDQT